MKFKVGDVVKVISYSQTIDSAHRNAIGRVISIKNMVYPIRLKFPNGSTDVFAEEELEIAKSHIINQILSEI